MDISWLLCGRAAMLWDVNCAPLLQSSLGISKPWLWGGLLPSPSAHCCFPKRAYDPPCGQSGICFFASIQKNEVWDRKNEITKKKRSPSGSIFLVPRYYTRLAPSASCRAWFCLPVCCCGWAVVLAALGWLWGVVVGEPLVWKGGKGRQQMHNSVLSLARAPSLGWGFGRTWL